ncbi:MAG: hypothetical protein WDM79_08740 [Terricaulis sp.]
MSESNIAAAELEERPIKGRSLWEDAWRRLVRNKAAMISAFVLIVLILLAVVGPEVWIHPYDMIFREAVGVPPTWENWHILGTDSEGRDVTARLLLGLRISPAGGAGRHHRGAHHRRDVGRYCGLSGRGGR